MVMSQKFNGRNIQNNEVVVDYKTHDVSFVPIYESVNINKLYLRNVCYALAVPTLVLIAFLWVAMFGVPQNPVEKGSMMYTVYLYEVATIYLTAIFGLVLVCILVKFQVKGQLKNQEWRENKFPDMNVSMHNFTHRVASCGLSNGVNKRVYKDDLKSDVIVKEFRNVMLDYEATGDYRDFLERVEIKSQESGKKWKDWLLYFRFSQVPKVGELKIKYV